MSSNRSQILIADDHVLVAELCKGLLEPEFDVVDFAYNGYDVLRAAMELKPAVSGVSHVMRVVPIQPD